ncbi:hypothetical protein [Mycobacterium avium]|uniref:hypothetical protein n=1 Tax=Mycobacterium avium TaxID=1764 RepID=UPI003AFB1969
MGGGIYLGLLTDFCVASEDAYFQMPLAQRPRQPGVHTMTEPCSVTNWPRTMAWLLLAPNPGNPQPQIASDRRQCARPRPVALVGS